MARMKVFFLSLCLIMALALPAPLSARADEAGYAVAPTEDVWFYAAENEDSRLFLLPATYYVRVLEKGEVYSTVEYLTDDAPYKKLLGYCRTEQLLPVAFVPARPYLRKQVTLSYTLPDAGGLGDTAFSSVERTFVYYGERTEGGQLYFYVYDGETFGYVPASEPVDFERNEDYLAALAGEGGETAAPAPEESPSESVVPIVVICLICAATVVIAVLVLRGKRPASHSSDF